MSAMPPSQSPKTALVIGSSGNIGFATTQFLIDSGVHVIAADYDDTANKNALASIEMPDVLQSPSVTFAEVDASDVNAISDLINDHQPDIVISTLPPGKLAYNAAFASAREKTNYVSSNFLTEQAVEGLNAITTEQTNGQVANFEDYVQAQGVASEWGKGLDPGLDFWLFEMAVEDFKGGEIHRLTSTGAGIAEEPEDVYIYTWAGITNGMGHRPASIVKDGKQTNIGAREKFSPENRENMSHLTLHDGTHIETYANDDGIFHLLDHAEELGIDTTNVELAATLTGRHEGHCEMWDPLVRQLDMLNDEETYPPNSTFADVLEQRMSKAEHSADTNGGAFTSFGIDTQNPLYAPTPLLSRKDAPTAKDIVEDHLSQIYARQTGKRDRSVIHIDVEGITASGVPHHKSLEINSYGSDQLNGLTSMQKTVAGTMVESALQLLETSPHAGLNSTQSSNVDPNVVFESMLQKGMITLSDDSDAPDIQLDQAMEP